MRTAEKLLNLLSRSQPADLLHHNHLGISATVFQMLDFDLAPPWTLLGSS